MRTPVQIDLSKADPELLALGNNDAKTYINFIKTVEKELFDLSTTIEGRKKLRNARVTTK